MTPRQEAVLIVIAKAPVAGRVKTRLCPPCSPSDAARLAEAALIDTLLAVAATQAAGHVLVLEGAPGTWVPPIFTVIPQASGGLGERLHAAFVAVGAPALLVGMDTPQVTPALLDAGVHALAAPTTDAVLGFADDGGYWAIGLDDPYLPVFKGVPMSADSTGAAQHAALRRLGLRVTMLPALRDVDHYDDAAAVAAASPDSRFAAAFATVDARLARA